MLFFGFSLRSPQKLKIKDDIVKTSLNWGICMHLVQFVGVESVTGVTVLEGGGVGERAHQARPPVLSHILYQQEI
jgi:hypothetical protein